LYAIVLLTFRPPAVSPGFWYFSGLPVAEL
jgi:hypothetical protein